MDRLKLKELINTAINKLQDDKYRNDTIEDYKFTWKKFYEMCELFNVEYFDYNIAMKFLEKYYHIDIKNGKGRTHTRRMRAMHILNSLDKNEKIGIYKKVLDKKIPNSYRGVFNEFEEFLIKEKYVQSTINDFKNTLCKFFQFLNFNKIDSINKVKINDIYKFINFINTKNYSQATVYAIKYKLKYFFQYLFENGKFNYSGNDIFPRIAKFDRLKLTSYYSMDDINKIIEQVDTNTKRGKRDLAILLLATVYGLRNSDIVHLKKENIIWNQNKIELIQYKTKRLLELPLTDNVKFAILDYLKNARPNVESEYVFLPTRPPYKYVDMEHFSSLHKSMSDYAKKAGVYTKNKKLGLHALRHSLASNMLKNNIDVKTISSVLGHSSCDVTNIYLNIDIDQLRNLSLEVNLYE